MTATSEFLLADARAALRRRLPDPDRTELSRVFPAWLLREPQLTVKFVELVAAAAERKGHGRISRRSRFMDMGSAFLEAVG